ncbi:DUF5908 family protein [Reinekea sp. G2M2-21]|jgi:hypothetical protein|uniref:DUF5908 family protein n=1 Tax=Reinekea sp. G2M2-21 TaxID=2788942 RepID=UPI0018ABE23F|nr:DUF5908 family protein [Reinekea sp. G2M2-21]MDX1473316.1 DUF5908 family protein [Reinekea sp.]
MTIEVKQLTIRSTVEEPHSAHYRNERTAECCAPGIKEEILKDVERLVKQMLRETTDR